MNPLDQTRANGYSISPALGEHLDRLQGHDDDDDDISDCPVVREAQRLSSFLLCAGDEANARSIDGNPWNGVNHEGLRADALYLVRQIDRYLAARKGRFGVEADQWVPKEVIMAERAKLQDTDEETDEV
jgi:hypothetical protein